MLKIVPHGDAEALARVVVDAASNMRTTRCGYREPGKIVTLSDARRELLGAFRHAPEARRAMKMERIIENGGGRKELQGLSHAPELKQRITQAKTTDGKVHMSPKYIAEVFTGFYASLCGAVT